MTHTYIFLNKVMWWEYDLNVQITNQTKRML